MLHHLSRALEPSRSTSELVRTVRRPHEPARTERSMQFFDYSKHIAVRWFFAPQRVERRAFHVHVGMFSQGTELIKLCGVDTASNTDASEVIYCLSR